MNTNTDAARVLTALSPMLPASVNDSLRRYTEKFGSGGIDELRLRTGGLWLTVNGENVRLAHGVIGAKNLSDTVVKLCGGSVYAHSETLREGYISVRAGLSEGMPSAVRAGVCGRAVVSGGAVTGVRDITSINLRIPKRVPGCADGLYRELSGRGFYCGALIYSPPGVGKTTLLRELIPLLADGDAPLRTAVVDTRGELAINGMTGCADILTSYPKAAGIEIAARTLNAQIIVCDEIDGLTEAEAVRNAHNNGVPVIAAVHAVDFIQLRRKPSARPLLESGAFDIAVGLERRGGSREFKLTVDGINGGGA